MRRLVVLLVLPFLFSCAPRESPIHYTIQEIEWAYGEGFEAGLDACPPCPEDESESD